MKTLARIAAATVLLLTPSFAQANPDARVSLRVEGRELSEIVQYLRDQSGANIVVLQGADSPISLELTDVVWREALELAAELAGCVVEERTAGVLVLDRPPRVTFAFTNSDIAEVIDAIAKISGANIVVAPEVSGTLSLRLTDVPWRDALSVATKTLGYTIVEEDRGILRVVDPISLQAQMETRSYQLRFLRPKGNYEPIITSEFVWRVGGRPTARAGASVNIEDVFPAIKALKKALSPGGDMDYVPSQNVLIVRDTAQVHAEIQELIDRLDIEPAQIFVDVKFVTTTNNDLLNLGIDYGDEGPSVSASGGAIPITFPFNMGSGGFEDGLIANDSGVGPFTDPVLNAGATFIPDTVFGALDFQQVQATLRLFQQDSASQVVQAPKLLALDNKEATIFVGETVRYAEAKTEQGQAGGLELSVVEAENSPVEVGFQLLIVPHVIPGTNKVTMDVIPKETSLSGQGESSLAPAGFDIFTVGASGIQGSIALPRKRSSTIVTTMTLESGQTAIIGGLTTDVDFEQVSKIPLLGDIPVLGELFKHRETSKDRRSLLVFITVTIVRTNSEMERLLTDELELRKEQYGEHLRELLDPQGKLMGSEDEETAAPVLGAYAPAGEDYSFSTFVEEPDAAAPATEATPD